MTTANYRLTTEQADSIIERFVEQALKKSKDDDGIPSYANVCGRLQAILGTLLTGQSNPTLDDLIKQAGF